MYQHAIMLFRRDLNLADNTALREALAHSREVIACFIADPQQVEVSNPYRSLPALQFMLESLEDLHKELEKKGGRLYIFYGDTTAICKTLFTLTHAQAVYINADYTPFARQRDEKIRLVCTEFKRDFHSYDDLCLHAPGTILKVDGSPYIKFTPFYHAAVKKAVTPPDPIREARYTNRPLHTSLTIAQLSAHLGALPTVSCALHGGRTACTELLHALPTVASYETTRNFPAQNSTTHLSAHHKFTTYSIREVYAVLKEKKHAPEALLRQLYWRDFFIHIAAHFPHVFGHSFYKQYDKLSWQSDNTLFELWKAGMTGFPLVDAGMRELNMTGWMHNRVRLVTASFLTKDLHIDWRKGEKYFATQLVDYDPAVNNGNWQWVASTGCDTQPYYRIFNPWLQAQKFDPDAVYIKQWIPELENIAAHTIHRWYDQAARPTHHAYPAPILDHKQEAAQAVYLFKRLQR